MKDHLHVSDKAFKKNGQLKQHKVIHTNERQGMNLKDLHQKDH